MIKYVLGFAFNLKKDQVLLIHKTKDDWQNGLWNGIGGRIDEDSDDSSYGAMIREFKEETGIETKEYEWLHTVTMCSRDGEWEVAVFRSFLEDARFLHYDNKIEDEGNVSVVHVDKMNELDIIKNLQWLIPVQLSKMESHITVIEDYPNNVTP